MVSNASNLLIAENELAELICPHTVA